ncbi:MAG: beta-galactosidase, partial [Armatimonadetes bacterium]|nr:beta-galactosidase [Armatimonadota bacterium]
DVTEALWLDDLECVEGSAEDLERRTLAAKLRPGARAACRLVLESPSALESETIRPVVRWVAAAELPGSTVRLELVGAGKPLAERSRAVEVTAGDGRVSLECPLAGVPGGRHRVVARLVDAGGRQVAVDEAELAKGVQAPYELAVRRLLDHFVYCVDQDLTKTKVEMWSPKQVIEMKGQAKRDAVARAAGNAAFMVARGREAMADLRRAVADPKARRTVPEPDLSRLTIAGGQFRAGGVPVFLIGSLCWTELEQDMPILREYGFNFAELEGGPRWLPEDPAAPADSAVEPRLLRAAENHLAVDRLLSLHYLPDWLEARHPGETCLDYPWRRQLLERWLRPLARAHAGQPALQSYILANEPSYQCYCAESQKAFRAAMLARYGAIAAANAVWGTDFAGFERLEVQRDTRLTPGLRYDWCRFNEERHTRFFRWLKGVLREEDPRTPVHIKISNDQLWYGDYFDSGLDREALAEVCDVVGCDGNFFYPGSEFAMGFEGQVMAYDLLKSFAPDKPIIDSEWTTGGPGEYPAEYFHTALWQSFLHGVCGANIWVWDRNEGAMELRDRFLRRAPALYGASRAALDLRRLAPQVALFPQQPAQVAILLSEPSVLHSDYLTQLRRLYTGLCFLDTPLRFVTERQAARGGLARYKLLVVPQVRYAEEATYEAVRRYAAAGHPVVLVGECFGFDEHGRPRDVSDLRLPGVFRMQPADGAVSEPVFDALIDEAGVDRPVRVRPADGRAVRGVESRTVKTDGGYLTYLINLNREARTVRLETKSPILAAVDLVVGQPVKPGGLRLPSLSPMLLRLELQRR